METWGERERLRVDPTIQRAIQLATRENGGARRVGISQQRAHEAREGDSGGGGTGGRQRTNLRPLFRDDF